MNHVYRIVYNRELGVMQVVPEIANAHGKGNGGRRGGRRVNRLLLAMLLSLASMGAGATVVTPPQDNLPVTDAAPQGGALPAPPAIPANTLPTSGSVSVGNGNISTSGSVMTVQQQSQYLAIDWQTFDIGSGASVNFLQPNANAIALNRVLGSSTSNIFGKLTGNGQVWLLNPNGVLFGSSAQVNVGGLVASTLALSDDDFIAGNYRFSGSGGSVVNQGSVNAGYAALLGETVRNEGTIAARMGTVALAAGNKVTLDFNGDQLLNVQVDEGALHALVDNRGLIQADGGTVLMTARAKDALLSTAVNNSGVIQARTVGHSQGRILLLGDADSGTVNVTGTLDASAPLTPSPSPSGGEGSNSNGAAANGAASNGGFIETSAAHVNVADSAVITTKAASGQSGTWLIDPNDFTIAQSGGNITGAAVGTALDNNGNVIIATATSGTAGGSGDINVNDAVNWSSNNSLTLQAERSVNVNAAITATGNGAGLVVDYNQGSGITDGNFYVNATVNLPVTGSLAINGQAYTLITSLAGLSNPNGYYALVQDSSAAITATLGNLTGTLEGLGHRVSGININAASDQYVGLFNTLNQGSVVRNLSIDGSVTGNRFVGLLAAVNQGTVVNVHSSGSVNSSTGSAGGLVYGNGAQIGGGNYVAGVIDRSSSSATVTSAASNSVGGLVGSNSSLGIISNSYATGNVSSSQIVGGLAGTNAGTIVNSYATGNVSALPNGFAGGLVGSNNGDISFSYATGSVTGSARIGGLVGHNFGGSISNSYATGAVSGTSYVGGLVGINQGDLSNSYWDSYTTGQSDAVGYQPVGTATNVSAVTSDPSQFAAANYAFKQSAYANFDFGSDWFMVEGSSRPLLRAFLNQADSNGLIAVTNLYQLQGMAANLSGHYLLTQDIDASATAASTQLADVWGGKGFAAIGTVASKFTGSFDGQGHVIDGLTINRGAQDNVGLFGYAGDGAVFANVGLSNANITGRAFVGTLLGRGNTDAVAIDNAWSSGTVTSTSTSQTQGAIGGLVGGMSGTIANSHSSATVTGHNRVGGLVGQMSVSSDANKIQQISNSYATGDVSATFGYGGGLVGRNFARIANSYATGDVSGGTVLGGLVGYGSIATYWNNQQDPNTKDSYLNVYASGNVTGTGNDVGGLFGLTQGLLGVHNAFATGNVVGAKNVGGLIGRVSDGGSSSQQASLWSVYTQGGTVTGQDNVGGLIGSSGWVHVTNSYSASGLLTATDSNAKLGGLIGGNNTALSANIFIFDNGVWNIETTGTDFAVGDNAWGSFFITAPSGTQYLASGHTVGATTAQMMTVEPYAVSGFNNGQGGLVGYSIVTAANAAGNDYSQLLYSNNIYFLYEGQTYPLLRAFLQQVTVNADLSGANKTYDGQIASGTVGSYTTSIPVDASLILGSLSYATNSANAGTYTTGSGLNVSGGLYSGQLGYEITYSPTTSLTINPAALTITANDASKTYDGLTWTGGNGVTYSGFVNGEDANVLSGTLTWGGTGQGAVNAGVYSLIASGLSSGNYVITYQDGTLNIAKASAVITANSGTLTYNGLLQAITGYTVTGLVPGDATSVITGLVETGGSGINAGTYAHTVSGGSAANYNLIYVPGSLTINPASLTITANDASKTYDGLAWTGGNGVTYSGFVNGEDANVLSGTLTWGGTGQGAVNAGVYSLIASGLSSGNYVITYQDGTLNIAKASAVITANSGTLTYNGLLQAITGYTVTGLVPGDATSVITGLVETGGSGINAGTYAHTVSGGSAANYNLIYVPGSLIINPAALTITANDASKTYDGLAWTGGNGVTYSGFVNGEDANVLSGTLTWGGTGQGAVNAGVYSLIASGLSSGNYVITYQDGTLNIAKANAVITANSGTLTYNGLLQAITGYSITGLVPGDATSVITGLVETGGAGTNAGTYAHTVSGGSAANYTLTYVPGALTINPAALTITANDASKTYDGLAWTGGNGVTYSGFVNGEDANVLSGTLTWGGTGQGAVNAGVYSLIASGLSSGNYVITYQDGTLNIAKASAVITANSGTLTYNGLLQAITGYTVTGLVPGDATSVITGLVETGGSGINAGTYAHTVSGGSAANYNLTYVPGSLTINPAALTITANDASKTYDGLAWTGGNGVTYSGFVNGEDANVLSGTLTWGGTGQGAVNAGVYSLIASGLSSGNYVITYQDGTLNIAKANAIITANSGTLTYNGLLQAITGYSITGLVPGDATSVITGLVETGGSGINAGTYAHTVSGGSAANYNLTYVDGSLLINPASITVTTGDVSKIYDGTTDADGSLLIVDGQLYGSDSLSGGSFAFTDKNAGTDKTVTVGGVTVSDGNNGGNYVITYVANNHSTVLQKVLTVGGGFNAADKIYDGTTDAQILQSTLALVGVVAGDSVGLDWAAAFADADVGLDKLVALLGGTLYGDDRLNYRLDWIGAPTAQASIFGSGAAIFGPGLGAAQASVDAAAEQAVGHPAQGTADITVLQCGQNLPPELVKDCR